VSPIIDLQRRMQEAGRIRAGDRANGNPRKLSEWRLTSKDKQRLEAAAGLWGGSVSRWEDRGEWELYTSTAELPIMLLPGQLPTTWYELWSKGGCQRRCDGQHEVLSDSACLCGDERECKPTTRLSVLLPDLPGVGSWLVQSTGWNAAAELAGAAELLGRASAQGVLIPARLRLEQRTDVKAGQTRKYAVPVIDVDVSFRDLLGGGMAPPALAPADYTPLVPIEAGGVSVKQALLAAETQQPTRTARSAAPMPLVDDVPFGDEQVPVPIEGQEVLPLAEEEPDGEKRTGPQTKKLNVLVGRLREAGHISTEQLWAATANGRNIDVDLMVELLGGKDEEGGLHWGPLRDSLNKAEASALIDRLERYEEHIATAEAHAS